MRRPTVCVELLHGPDLLEGPCAAVVDTLGLLNALAQARGARRAVVRWQWRGLGGATTRRRGSAGGRTARPDVLVVPGWNARNGAHLSQLVARDRAVVDVLQAVHAAGGQVLALYTGVALAGEAGLLDGRRGVVPWPFIPSVLRHAPHIDLAAGDAWVEHERIWTADSPVLATELVLRAMQACGLDALVEAGRAVMLHTPERQQLSRSIAAANTRRVGAGTLERARRWLDAHWHEPYRLADVARASGFSERSLLRHFRAAYGMSPLQRVHELRVTHARVLLETTYLPIEAIAEQCGWRDSAALREVFARATGSTPAAYRERHRLRTRRRQWGADLGR